MLQVPQLSTPLCSILYLTQVVSDYKKIGQKEKGFDFTPNPLVYLQVTTPKDTCDSISCVSRQYKKKFGGGRKEEEDRERECEDSVETRPGTLNLSALAG
jgi:hypothetical protein